MEQLLRQLNQLQLTQKSAISLAKTGPEYILALAAQNKSEDNQSLLAATSSNFSIKLYNKTTIIPSSTVKGHTNVITGLTFGKEDPNLLITSSLDKTVRCWDLRCDPENEVQSFQGACNVGFGSVDINCNDRLLCAGTEVDRSKDVFMLFWDRRKSSYLGSYTESFENELTQVCFHPSKPDHIASGSTDGLVCIFNINETEEEDALISTLNTELFVAKIGWCGEDYKDVFCITDVDTYHVWDALEADVVKEVLNIKEKLKGEDSIDYLIDVIATQDRSKHILAAGTKTGDVKLLDVTNKPDVITCLHKGHKDIVRCIYYNNQNNTLVTGGEDSLLCLWSSQPVIQSPSSDFKGKLKVKQTPTKKSKPYKR